MQRTIAAVVLAVATQTAAAATLDVISVDGTLTVGGPGTSSAGTSIGLDTPGQAAGVGIRLNEGGGITSLSQPLVADLSVANGDIFAFAAFSDSGAQATFGAPEDDGFADLGFDYFFSPVTDATVVIEWDYTNIDVRQGTATVSLFDLTTESVVFEQRLTFSGVQASFVEIEVLASNEYVWSFGGTVTDRREGSASASIEVVGGFEPLVGDVNLDFAVTSADLLAVLSNFGAVDVTLQSGDVTADGVVTSADLLAVLSNFGTVVAN